MAGPAGANVKEHMFCFVVESLRPRSEVNQASRAFHAVLNSSIQVHASWELHIGSVNCVCEPSLGSLRGHGISGE